MTNLIVLLDFLTFLAGSALGAYVFVRNPRSPFHQAFAVTMLGVAGWSLCIFLLISKTGPALPPGRLGFSFLPVLVFGLVWFASIFPTRAKFAKFFIWLFGILGVIFFLIPVSPWFVTHIEIMDPGFITGDLHPVLFPIWSYYYQGSLVFILLYLLARCIAARGVQRLQLAQILMGFTLFLVPMVATQIIMPLVFHDFRFNNLGPVFTIVMMGFFANAILRYRLLDIRWIVSKSLIFTLLGTLIIWLITTTTFLLSGFVDSPIAIAIGALIIVLLYRPIEGGLDRVIDFFANKGWYDPETATKEVFEVVRTHGDLNELTENIGKLFSHYFSTEQIALMVFQRNSSNILQAQIHGFSPSITRQTKPLLEIAKKYGQQIVERGEMAWRLDYEAYSSRAKLDRKYKPLLEKLQVQTLVPFVVDGNVIGFMLFGKRRYDRALRDRDIRFLDLIRAGISPALENAAKYAEIKMLYEQLSEADRVKSEFINVVSHRFRTPLAALRWNLETVIDNAKRLSKDSQSMLTDSHDRTMFLVNTLEGLFDALALESGRMKIDRAPISLNKVFAPIVSTYEKKAREKGLSFTAKIPALKMVGDEKRLGYVLDVLLSNAVLYTAKGDVQLIVGKKGSEAFIQVTDSGIGIPPKDQSKIFQKFFRARNAVSQYADGQGLGLYLVSEIAKLHKGRVDLESTLNKGTTVTVWLPMA